MAVASLSGATVGVEEALVLLLIIAATVAVVVRRVGVPYTVGLVVVGLVVGLVSHVPTLRLSSDLVFYVFLPILLFEAAFNLEASHLITDWRRILALAVPGVLVAFALTSLGVRFLGGSTWVVALLFWALIAATDPVSVVALFRRLGVQERLTTMIDAESLFNDGTAALAFVVAVAALGSDPPTLGDSVARFAMALLASVVIGGVSGLLISRVLRTTSDHLIELTLTLLAAYGTYLVADLVHASGIIASVVAGIVLGSYGKRKGMSPRALDAIDVVWEFLAFILTGAAFLLIGIAIPLSALAAAAVSIVWGVVAVLAGRAIVIYALLGGAARLERRIGLVPSLPLSWLHVMNWTGLRGAVAAALALSIPEVTAYRALLQGIVFGVVLFTLLVQGTTAGRVLRLAGVGEDDDARAGEVARDA